MAHLEKNAELISDEVMSSFLRRREMWLNLFEQEEEAKKRMEEIAKTDDDAQRIMTVPGVGAQTAVGLLVHIGGDIGRFKNSGQFAASIGLVPKQNSTGGNTTLNGITKCGPKRLRANLVQCGQVILMHADKLKGNFGDWVRKLRDSGKKRGVIVCAIAAKGSSSKALFNFTPRELSSITQAKLLHKRLFRVLLKSFPRSPELFIA